MRKENHILNTTMKKKRIYICWYHYVEYAYGISPDDFFRKIWVKKLDWITIIDKWKAPWIYIANLSPAVIAHEAFHAVFHVANNVWINLSRDSEEWYAHSIDKIVSEIMKIHKL